MARYRIAVPAARWNTDKPASEAPVVGNSAASEREPPRFDAIAERHTNHRPFDATPVPTPILEQSERDAHTADLGLELVTDSRNRADIATLQACADERLFAGPAYRAELASWIGSGALGANWLASRIGRHVVRHLDIGGREARGRTLPSSGGHPSSGSSRRGRWTSRPCWRRGRVSERIALRATSEGLATHPMSQILEVDELRDDLAEFLELDEAMPLHRFRLGYAEPDPTRTPRRPVEELCP